MGRSVADILAEEGIVPIPLRAGLTVQIVGLPRDLTLAEAARIGGVVKALASEGSALFARRRTG